MGERERRWQARTGGGRKSDATRTRARGRGCVVVEGACGGGEAQRLARAAFRERKRLWLNGLRRGIDDRPARPGVRWRGEE